MLTYTDSGDRLLEHNLTISDTTLKKETEYEEFILHHIHEIAEIVAWPEIKRLERQFRVNMSNGEYIKLDAMLWHVDGTGTCIEVKTGQNNRNDHLTGISQLLFYGKAIKESCSQLPRLVLFMPEIEGEMFSVIKEYNLPISLMQFNEGKCIFLSNAN